MMVKLLLQALEKFPLGVLLVGTLIFPPAETFSYFGSWLLMGILFLPTFAVGLVMMFIRLGLLAKKKQKEQRLVVKLSALMFVAGFVLAGLGQRFGWYCLPWWSSAVILTIKSGANTTWFPSCGRPRR